MEFFPLPNDPGELRKQASVSKNTDSDQKVFGFDTDIPTKEKVQIDIPQGEELLDKENVYKYPKYEDGYSIKRQEVDLQNPDLFNDYLHWIELAKKENVNRPLWKKIVLPLKKITPGQTGMKKGDSTQHELRRLSEEDTQIAETLKSDLKSRFHSLLSCGLGRAIGERHVDMILSEDASGRLPALIFKNALDRVYEKKNLKRTGFMSIPISTRGNGFFVRSNATNRRDIDFNKKEWGENPEVVTLAKEFSEKLRGSKTCLYFTDIIASAKTLLTALIVLEMAFDMLDPETRPSKIIVVSMTQGGAGILRQKGNYDLEIISYKSNSKEPDTKRFSGIKRDPVNKLEKDRDIEFGKRKQYRAEIINRVSSDLSVELQNYVS